MTDYDSQPSSNASGYLSAMRTPSQVVTVHSLADSSSNQADTHNQGQIPGIGRIANHSTNSDVSATGAKTWSREDHADSCGTPTSLIDRPHRGMVRPLVKDHQRLCRFVTEGRRGMVIGVDERNSTTHLLALDARAARRQLARQPDVHTAPSFRRHMTLTTTCHTLIPTRRRRRHAQPASIRLQPGSESAT
jgi:hypothetical protein